MVEAVAPAVTTGKVEEWLGSRAGDTASVARVAEEERLRNQFRARTGDPLAFVPSAIPAVPTGTNGGAA